MAFDSVNFTESEAPVAFEPWRQVLLGAADRIEINGFGKGDGLSDPEEGDCVVTAACRCASLHRRTALRKFAAWIGVDYDDIEKWNDAPGRTAAEVLAALRSCARS